MFPFIMLRSRIAAASSSLRFPVSTSSTTFSFTGITGPSCQTHVPNRSRTTVKVPYPPLTDISAAGIAQPTKGKMYDKKPFKVSLVKGKKYAWCCCGWSKSQPFCDGTHANTHMRLKLGPVVFIAPETMDYWLCNCKQTAQRPFCDGTHRTEEVQTGVRS